MSPGNLLSLVRSVSVLGILGVGMAIVVIGPGMDLAIVATYAMSAAWTLHLATWAFPYQSPCCLAICSRSQQA